MIESLRSRISELEYTNAKLTVELQNRCVREGGGGERERRGERERERERERMTTQVQTSNKRKFSYTFDAFTFRVLGACLLYHIVPPVYA